MQIMRSLILTLLIMALAVGPVMGQPSVTKSAISTNTPRADGSAAQNNDSLFWSTALKRWVSGAPTVYGDMSGAAASTDSELPLFSGTGGKTLKRSNTLSGIPKLASGVVTIATAGTDYSIPITAAPADTSYSGPTITCKNGEAGSMALGDVVYISNGGTATTPTVKLGRADATASDAIPAMGMVLATITTGNTGPVLLSGFVQNTGWGALTVGGVAGSVWLSITGTTGNTWTQTEPVAAGNISQYLGCAINDAYSAAHTGQSKTIFFNPSPVWVVK